MINKLPMALSVLMVLGSTTMLNAMAGTDGPMADIHYRVAESKSNIEPAIHFFSFGCHHCYRFEPLMESWSDKKEIAIQRIPVTFGKKQWEHYAKLYFSLQILTGNDEFTGELFTEIHENRNKSLSFDDLQSVLNLSAEEKEQLSGLYASADVDLRMEQARNLAKDYGITGVPAMVVKGQYVSDAAMARGIHGLIGVVDYLFGVEPQEG